MKHLVFLPICLSSLSINAQEVKPEFDGHKWEAPYHLPIPKDWTFERFLVPISFAPQIPYKGVEDIRFNPGWGNVKSDDYWSYAFLWYLDGSPKTDAQIIAANLKAYYTGLATVNIDTAKLKALPQKLKAVTTSFQNTQTSKGDLKTYTGTVAMLDYMQLKRITLNCIVHVKPCSKNTKTIVFYELSPKPFSHNVWAGLNKLWLDFICTKKGTP
ncbi:MAG TPA: hypothetical protein VM884_10060 [Flavisolibacter sp.]|nr:hypothetical protein [Flavisolibacter sp.]